MLTPKTQCEYCQQELVGRADKTFCGRRCKELAKQKRNYAAAKRTAAVAYNQRIVASIKEFQELLKSK